MSKQKHIGLMMKPFLAQAAFEGRKTMTRRTKGLEFFNKKPQMYRYDGLSAESQLHYLEELTADGEPREYYLPVECPYGQVGDLIWVKETWQTWALGYIYKANYGVDLPEGIKWKSSMLMPKVAARTWGVITSIRVERLQSIKREDCINEGIGYLQTNTQKWHNIPGDWYDYERKTFAGLPSGKISPSMSFKSLWQSINGPKSWDSNPWVWVIEFERCDAPALEGGAK